jgi:hypothetical protein
MDFTEDIKGSMGGSSHTFFGIKLIVWAKHGKCLEAPSNKLTAFTMFVPSSVIAIWIFSKGIFHLSNTVLSCSHRFSPVCLFDNSSRSIDNLQSFLSYIQGGNLNWNKNHNLKIGNFCKKSRNRSIFIFPSPHFDAYCFCISASGSAQPPPTFFFKWKGMSSDAQARGEDLSLYL